MRIVVSSLLSLLMAAPLTISAASFKISLTASYDAPYSGSNILCGEAFAWQNCRATTLQEIGDGLVTKYYCNRQPYTNFEDDVIELTFAGENHVSGYWWCSSDEFSDAREGYLPGFIVLPMDGLRLEGDSLLFALDSHDKAFFAAPIDISVHSTEEAAAQGYQPWKQMARLFYDRVDYHATFLGDTIRVMQTKHHCPEPKLFLPIDKDSIQYLNRMPIADEELFSFFWEYMQARIRDQDNARAECLLRQYFVPEALAKLRQMDEDCGCDCLFNGKELSKEYSFETLKCQSKENGWYDVSFCANEQSPAEHIFLHVNVEKGVVRITDIGD